MDPLDDNEQIEELIYSEEGEEYEEESVDILPTEEEEQEEEYDEEEPSTSQQVITGDLPTKNIVCIKSPTGTNIPVHMMKSIKNPQIASQVQRLMGKQMTIVSKTVPANPVVRTVGQRIAMQGDKKIVTISPSQQQFKVVSSSGTPTTYLTKVTKPTQKIIVKTSPGASKISGTFIDVGGLQKKIVRSAPQILNLGASSSQARPTMKAINVGGKVQVVRVINPKTPQQSLQKIVLANTPKIKTEPSPSPPQKLVIQSKNGQCFYVATSQPKTTATKYTVKSEGSPSKTPVPASKIVLDKDKLKVVFPEPTILNSSVSSTSKSFPVHVYTSRNSMSPNSPTITTVRNFSNKPIITERKVEVKEKVDIEKLLEGQGVGDGKRRPCNCTRSQCLKLYCECFANGEFCKNCNCKECYNSLEYEDERQKAIRLCLDRNPNAFRPKIVKYSEEDAIRRQHNKGCNCKRSGCLKNYCECYEAKISCSNNCKCFGCRNVEGYFPPDDGTTMVGMKRQSLEEPQGSPRKQACNFMTPDVVEASIQCMIAQADDCQKSSVPFILTEKMILEEFGRCLAEIIDFSFNNGE